jgi:hypothetical protein
LSRQQPIEGITMHVGQFAGSEDRRRVDGQRLKIEERTLLGNPVAWRFRQWQLADKVLQAVFPKASRR